MKRLYYAALVLLGLAALTAGLMLGCGRNGAPGGAEAEAADTQATPVSVATAMRGAIEDTLELSGTAEAQDEVDVVPEMAGKVTGVYADVGDYVRRGQTLVRLDTQLASAQASQAAAGVNAAQASLEQARTARDLTDSQTAIAVDLAESQLAAAREQLRKAETAAQLTERTVTTNIDQARTGVQTAEARLAEVRAGARAQQLAQVQAQVDQAKASLDLAEQTYQRYRNLYEGGAIPEVQLDQMRTQYEVAQAQYRQALEAKSLTEEGARSEQVRQAELAVQAAQEQLRLAEASRGQITIARHDVDTAREGVRQAQENLNAAIANREQVQVSERQIEAARAAIGQATAAHHAASVSVNKHTVHAPISGLVARRMVDQGEGATPGVPVMRLVNINPIRVDAVVSELDVDRVRVGDRAVVSFDGLPDDEFLGTVVDIAPQATMDSRNFVARLHVDNPAGAIKPGMFARVQLVLDSRSDSVLITRDALVERGEGRLVYVVRDHTIEVLEVEVGAITGNLVEILAGLREGDSVVVSGQDDLADGQRVEPQPRNGPSEDEEVAEPGEASSEPTESPPGDAPAS